MTFFLVRFRFVSPSAELVERISANAGMPDSVVVRCGQCSIFQVIPQLLPVKDGAYFNCDHCSSKNGEPSRQPCVVHRMPDGVVLRSYDVDEMRKQAKRLNAVGTSDRQDARMSTQKSRILHTLEEQRLRRIQARAPRHRSRHRAPRLTVRARATDKGEAAVGRYHREDDRRPRTGEHRQCALCVASPLTLHTDMGMHACARGCCRTQSLLLDSKPGDVETPALCVISDKCWRLRQPPTSPRWWVERDLTGPGHTIDRRYTACRPGQRKVVPNHV